MTGAEKLAETVISRAEAIGVSEFVVCAGSRNSPLVLELLRRQKRIRIWSFFEERSAGFFALGRSRLLEKPVAVLTTSGTAVANLYPAMIEALYLRAPLLAITADRPKNFRGTAAPQSIEQAGMFCLYARDSWDVDHANFDLRRWDGWGPAHLNVCLDEPLVENPNFEIQPVAPPITGLAEIEVPWKTHKSALPIPDVVLLGSLAPSKREEVATYLAKLGVPILADATSQLRTHPKLRKLVLRSGESVLMGGRIEIQRVLRIGTIPSFGFWRQLAGREEVQVYCAGHNGFTGLPQDVIMFDALESVQFNGEPSDKLLKRDKRRLTALEKALREFPKSEPGIMRALSEAIPVEATVFLGNSLPIREWNLAASYENRAHTFWANRGANGIDGNLSSYLGLGADAAESWGIFGDLTTLYDLSAPWILRDLPPTKHRFVVVNNGGGKIFSRLPSMSSLSSDVKKTTENSHEVGFESWAKMWGIPYRGAVVGELPNLEDLPDEVLLEIRPDEAATEEFWEALA